MAKRPDMEERRSGGWANRDRIRWTPGANRGVSHGSSATVYSTSQVKLLIMLSNFLRRAAGGGVGGG